MIFKRFNIIYYIIRSKIIELLTLLFTIDNNVIIKF